VAEEHFEHVGVTRTSLPHPRVGSEGARDGLVEFGNDSPSVRRMGGVGGGEISREPAERLSRHPVG
jgi:hypothetical protein